MNITDSNYVNSLQKKQDLKYVQIDMGFIQVRLSFWKIKPWSS